MSTENTKLQETLREVTQDMLSDESLNSIQEAFDQAVNERVDIHLEKALIEQDEVHAQKLEQLLEAIDNDHCNKLEKLVEAIDTNHAQKLQQIVSKYKNDLNSEAIELKESLIDNISNYLELYVDKALPADAINEAVNNKRAHSVLNELRQVLAVDGILAKESIKTAIQDGKRQIDESSKQVSKYSDENAELKSNLDRAQAELVLERKSQGLPERKRHYVMKVLEGKSAQFIAENFDYTVQLFEKEDNNARSQLREQVTKQRRVEKKNADVVVESKKQEQPIQESASNLDEDKADEPLFNTYMGELGKY